MQAHMKALMIENGRLLLKQVPVPKIANAEVLLEVEMSGICGTDLELLRGYYDFSGIPGHEFVATVKDGPDLWLNKRVVVDINLGCGDCDNCRLGVNNHCAHRTVIGIKQRAGCLLYTSPSPRDS